MSDINVVPYIDVMLVLLIIFMVTAPLMTQGMNVNLPTVSAQSISINDAEPIIVSVDADGNTYSNINSEPEAILNHKTIIEQIKNKMKMFPTTPVLIKGDKDAKHGTIITVMGLLQSSGIKEVGIITQIEE